jgi:hypothetical protein
LQQAPETQKGQQANKPAPLAVNVQRLVIHFSFSISYSERSKNMSGCCLELATRGNFGKA